MGTTSVNDAIADTLRETPNDLFYLNNGLTVICHSVIVKPYAQPEYGTFDINKFSIVNGAQTVGSITQVAQEMDLRESEARVFVTIIELRDTEQEFGSRVTKARNYQNQVRYIDFAAQDPQQDRLRREMAISGVAYNYKPSAELTSTDRRSISFDESSLALGCFHSQVDFAVITKRAVGQLRDPSTDTYRALFRNSLSGSTVYRLVQIFRLLESICSENEKSAVRSFDRLCYRHLRYLMYNLWARHSTITEKAELELSQEDKETVSREFDDVASVVIEEAERLLREKSDRFGVLALSKSLTDVRQLSVYFEGKRKEQAVASADITDD